MPAQADKGLRYDVKLATPLLVVSQVVVLNVNSGPRPPKEEILNNLAIMMRGAEQIATSVSGGGDAGGTAAAPPFGYLHVALRDCDNEEGECAGIIFDPEPLDGCSGEQREAAEARNAIRAQVSSAFSAEPKVWCLPPLVLSKKQKAMMPADYRKLAEMHEDNQEYVDKVDEMRSLLADHLASPRMLAGAKLTGATTAALMPQLRQALLEDSASISPPTMMESVHDAEAAAHCEATEAVLQAGCDALLDSLPTDPEQLDTRLSTLAAQATGALEMLIAALLPASAAKAHARLERAVASKTEPDRAVTTVIKAYWISTLQCTLQTTDTRVQTDSDRQNPSATVENMRARRQLLLSSKARANRVDASFRRSSRPC